MWYERIAVDPRCLASMKAMHSARDETSFSIVSVGRPQKGNRHVRVWNDFAKQVACHR
jgi:hypothetical protein